METMAERETQMTKTTPHDFDVDGASILVELAQIDGPAFRDVGLDDVCDEDYLDVARSVFLMGPNGGRAASWGMEPRPDQNTGELCTAWDGPTKIQTIWVSDRSAMRAAASRLRASAGRVTSQRYTRAARIAMGHLSDREASSRVAHARDMFGHPVRLIAGVPGSKTHRVLTYCRACSKWIPSGRMGHHLLAEHPAQYVADEATWDAHERAEGERAGLLGVSTYELQRMAQRVAKAEREGQVAS